MCPRGEGCEKLQQRLGTPSRAPSGDCCKISAATGVSGDSGLQQNVTWSITSCHVSGHRTSNIPPAKQSVKTTAPFRETGSVEATAKYLSMGQKDCREGLQDSVCTSSSAFQRPGLHFRETGTSAFVDTGIASSAGQRGHKMRSPARQRVRLLQPVFSGSQERSGVASNFRSSRVEPLPQNIQVQNVDNQDDCVEKGYLGVVQAQLSPAHVKSILNTLKNIKLGQKITVHYFQSVLGLMAAASTLIPLGLLHMRSFQLWLKARGFHPRANPWKQKYM